MVLSRKTTSCNRGFRLLWLLLFTFEQIGLIRDHYSFRIKDFKRELKNYLFLFPILYEILKRVDSDFLQ